MLDIFYNEIIKEASIGRIDCFTMYNIVFSTNIEGKQINSTNSNPNLIIPTLNIKNKEEFDKALKEYVLTALDFYNEFDFFEEIKDDEKMKIKTLMTILWSNATYEDFNDPVRYIENRTAFFKNDSLLNMEAYNQTLDSYITVKTIKSSMVFETPYRIKVSLHKEEDSINMPYIYLGVNKDTAYIYAIKNDKADESSRYQKKINRSLYQINEGLNVKEDNFENYDIGNLKDINPKFLLALNVVIGLLKKQGINKIVVPSILIERWNAKEIFFDYKKQQLLKKYSKDSVEKSIEELKEEHDRIQSNLTEKFLRAFRRLEFHHTSISVSNNPYEEDSRMFISLSNNKDYCNNSLLTETYDLDNEIKKI